MLARHHLASAELITPGNMYIKSVQLHRFVCACWVPHSAVAWLPEGFRRDIRKAICYWLPSLKRTAFVFSGRFTEARWNSPRSPSSRVLNLFSLFVLLFACHCAVNSMASVCLWHQTEMPIGDRWKPKAQGSRWEETCLHWSALLLCGKGWGTVERTAVPCGLLCHPRVALEKLLPRSIWLTECLTFWLTKALLEFSLSSGRADQGICPKQSW